MVSETAKQSLVDKVRQSPRLDFSNIPDDSWVKDKTILITGGASGFGAGFFRRWAAAGANVVIGDVNVQKGDQLVRDVKTKTYIFSTATSQTGNHRSISSKKRSKSVPMGVLIL